MKLQFKHLTEALVQTAPTTPFVVGGLQQQKGAGYVAPSANQINTAVPTITQSPVPGIPMPSGKQPVQPPQLPKSGLIDRSNLTPSALPQIEPTSITTPVVPPTMIPSTPVAPEQTGEWKGPQPQGAKPQQTPPAPAPSKPKPKTPPAAPSGKPDGYQKTIDMFNRRAEVEAARANYLEQQRRVRELRESYRFNRGYLKSLLSEQGGGGGFGASSSSKPGKEDPDTAMEKAIEYVKNNLKLGPIGSLIGKGVKAGYESGKGIIRDYVKPLAIEASPLLTPPKEAMASLTGRLSGLGYTERGIKDRMDYYKRLLGGSKQDPNTWSGAWKDEAAKLMTAALYDPRALSKLQ